MSFLGPGSADVIYTTDALFARHGIALVRCTECGHVLTDKHPLRPGVWIDLEEETGPSREQVGRDLDGYADQNDFSHNHPHRPQPAAPAA